MEVRLTNQGGRSAFFDVFKGGEIEQTTLLHAGESKILTFAFSNAESATFRVISQLNGDRLPIPAPLDTGVMHVGPLCLARTQSVAPPAQTTAPAAAAAATAPATPATLVAAAAPAAPAPPPAAPAPASVPAPAGPRAAKPSKPGAVVRGATTVASGGQGSSRPAILPVSGMNAFPLLCLGLGLFGVGLGLTRWSARH